MRYYNKMRHQSEQDGWRRQPAKAMHGRGSRRLRRHGFGRRGGGAPGEGRGRRRMFEGGELRLVMLLLMETEPRHGYDVIREIETRTRGPSAPRPRIAYPTPH